MIYKMTLKDSTDEMTFNLLEVPIVDKDIEGAVDNVTLDGNQYTDYLYLKKQYIQKWSIMCDEEYERLRGFYTRQFDEAEIPTYELYYGETIYNDYTLSGEYIYADIQGVEPARMSLAQLNGNATQTTYSGKNKVDGANPTDANFATASLSNNVIAVSSTATDTIPYARWVIDNLSANDVVRYSGVIMDSNGQIVLQYDNNGTWTTISGSTRQYTDGTTPATYSWTNTGNTTKVRFLLYANKTIPTGNSSSRYKNAILTVNNSDLSYEPFVGGTPAPNPDYPQPISVVTGENTVKIDGSGGTQEFPIDLGSIELAKIGTYQDRIYKENGRWWLEKQTGKVVLNGSENWTTRSGATTYAYSLADVFDGNNASGLSDHFRFIQGGASSGQNIECIASASTSKTLNIFTNEGSLNTVANLKTWLASNSVTVYYALATPTTTEITNQTLIDQLEALVNVSIATGIHNIFTEVASGNLNPVMIFDFIEVVSRRVTLVPETPVRLTLTDGGIINACGCRKDVQLTMRETIE